VGEAGSIHLIVAGTPHALRVPVTTIGRAAENDIVLLGPDAIVVSARHAELRQEDGRWRIRDLGSTNGTFVNRERVTETALDPPCTIQLGKGGPELAFTTSEIAAPPAELDRTIAAPATLDAAPLGTEQDRLLRGAIVRARLARRAGLLNQTGAIMREAMATAIQRSSRRLRNAIALLIFLLAAVTGYAGLRIYRLNRSKAEIDSRIAAIEQKLAAPAQSQDQADQLAAELDRYQNLGRELQKNMFYRLRTREREDFLDHEIRSLLVEFGAEVYSIPPGFRDAVNRYLEQYRGPDRPNMQRALTDARPAMQRVRATLAENNLPPDFAYMILVESALDPAQRSSAGCAGLWQFTPSTARAFGLRVNGQTDERMTVEKSTLAACKYIRDLILDFGSGSSVVLALAAYNLGPSKVKQAIHHVSDPIKQRSFWYLYRVRALPDETREYVPKVIAAMIIGRHPERYGF
jgi:soluble lytic murein transglycosylase-like protein